MTTGGFESGSDYVAARVSFDIDNSGVSSLKELSESLNNFRTATEAANRTGADFLKFLQQMTALTNQANEAQTQLVNTLNRMTDAQQSIMTGQGTQVSRGFPQGRVDPLSGMGGGAGTGSNRAPTASGVGGYLDNLSSQDPRKYLNMQNNWGNLRTGDVPANSPSDQDLQQHAERHRARDKAQNDQAVSTHMSDPFSPMQRRISGMTSGAASLLSELGPGGMGVGSVAQQGLMSLSGMLRESGAAKAALGAGEAAVPVATGMAGMLGRGAAFLGTGAGMAGLGIAGAAGAGLLYQQGGEMVQGYRQMGQQRGGGAGEGMGYEMAIRSMALNPFLTTDQARQIVSAGLSSGYTGKEFDTVTQFMATNLKDMNMSVAESMKIFKKNVSEGGMGSEELSTTMETLKKASKTGYSSLEQLQGDYANVSSAYINAGVPGSQASRQASTASMVFSDSSDLNGLFSQIAASSSNNDAIGAMMLNPQISGQRFPGGTLPGAALEASSNQNQGIYNILRYWANRSVQSSGGNKMIAVQMFQGMLQQLFPQIDWSNRTEVEKLLSRVTSDPNAVSNAEKKDNAARAEAMKPQQRSTGQKLGGMLGGITQMIGGGAQDLWDNLVNKNPGEGWTWDRYNRAGDLAEYSLTDERSTTLENLIGKYGAKGIEVSSDGKYVPLTNKDGTYNEKLLKEIAANKAKIRPAGGKGGEGVNLADIQNGGKNGFEGAYGGTPNNFSVSGALTVTIDQQGRATAPPTVELTPAQQGAYEGASDYGLNAPPPGDRRRRSGY